MYEMEGASQSHSSHEPIARPTEPAERATIGRRDLGELRSTRCPPPPKAPSGVARQFGEPLSRTPSASRSLAQTPGLWCSLALRFPPEPGPPSLVACEISTAAERRAQGVGRPLFKILYDGTDYPQNRARYPQSGVRCPPVVHRFIHTCTRQSAGDVHNAGGGDRVGVRRREGVAQRGQPAAVAARVTLVQREAVDRCAVLVVCHLRAAHTIIDADTERGRLRTTTHWPDVGTPRQVPA